MKNYLFLLSFLVLGCTDQKTLYKLQNTTVKVEELTTQNQTLQSEILQMNGIKDERDNLLLKFKEMEIKLGFCEGESRKMEAELNDLKVREEGTRNGAIAGIEFKARNESMEREIGRLVAQNESLLQEKIKLESELKRQNARSGLKGPEHFPVRRYNY